MKQEQFTHTWTPLDINHNTVDTNGVIHFRPWQAEAYATTDTPYSVVNVPTGAGKSILIKANAIRSSLKGRKTIISIPLRNIGSSFNDEIIHLPDLGEQLFEVSHSNNFITTSYNKDGIMAERFIKSLTRKRGNNIVLCTHITLANVYNTLLENNQLHLLDGCAIHVDEAHHIKHDVAETNTDHENVNRIGQLVGHCLSSGQINLSLITATMYRGDNADIIPSEYVEQFVTYTLPLDVYLPTLRYLKSFSFNIHVTSDDPTNIIRERVSSTDHALVFLPSVNSRIYLDQQHDKYSLVNSICDKFGVERNVQLSLDGQYKFADLVNDKSLRSREKIVSYITNTKHDRTNAPNIVTALNMFKEGSDFPLCNKIFIIGVRNSCTDLIQMVGRAFRDVESKEHIEVNLILCHPNQAEDKEYIATFVQSYVDSIIMGMMMEELVHSTPFKYGSQRIDDSVPMKQLLLKLAISAIMTKPDTLTDINVVKLAIAPHVTPNELDAVATALVSRVETQFKNKATVNKSKPKLVKQITHTNPIDALVDIDSTYINSYISEVIDATSLNHYRDRINAGKIGLMTADESMLQYILQYSRRNNHRYPDDENVIKWISGADERVAARAKELNISDALQLVVVKTRNKTIDCIEYHNEHGHYPPRSSDLGRWRYTKRDQPENSFTRNKCIKLATKMGHPNIFDSDGLNKYRTTVTKYIHCIKNHDLSSITSEDVKVIHHCFRAYNGTTKFAPATAECVNNLLAQYNTPDLFAYQLREYQTLCNSIPTYLDIIHAHKTNRVVGANPTIRRIRRLNANNKPIDPLTLKYFNELGYTSQYQIFEMFETKYPYAKEKAA